MSKEGETTFIVGENIEYRSYETKYVDIEKNTYITKNNFLNSTLYGENNKNIDNNNKPYGTDLHFL